MEISKEVKACVLCIQNEKDEFLILERSHKCRLQGWCLPGGRIEDNENRLLAALREAREETGIIVDESDVTYIGEEPSVKGYMVGIFHIKLKNTPVVTISEEHERFEWTSTPFDFNLAGNTGIYIEKILD